MSLCTYILYPVPDGLGMRLAHVLYGLGMRLARVLYGLGMRLSIPCAVCSC